MTAIPKSKEGACWENMETEEGCFDHKFFYHHTLFIGYNVTNTLYNTIEAGMGVWGLAPEKSLQLYF